MKHSIMNNDFVKTLFSVKEENISQPHILQCRCISPWNSKIYSFYYVCVKQKSLTIAHYLQGNLTFSNTKFLFPFKRQLWHDYFEIKVEKCLATKEYCDEKNASTLFTSEHPLCKELNEKCVAPSFSRVSHWKWRLHWLFMIYQVVRSLWFQGHLVLESQCSKFRT